MKSSYLILLLLLSLGTAPVSSESRLVAPNPILAEVISATSRLEKRPIDEPVEEVSIAWDYALSKHDSATAVSGIISLWKKKKRSLVELVWWRQGDPVARRSALLLFFALTKVEADSFPDFEGFASRFAPEEAASRRREIDDVKAVAENSRGDLLKALGIKE